MQTQYIVYGLCRRGQLHEVMRTRSALEASHHREASCRRWVRLLVHGPSGELTISTLERLAADEQVCLA